MCVRERHSLPSQLIGTGRFDLACLRGKAIDIAIAQIIAHHQHDVRFRGLRFSSE
jgi:hypothetical protein